jgi:hypothetical protein
MNTHLQKHLQVFQNTDLCMLGRDNLSEILTLKFFSADAEDLNKWLDTGFDSNKNPNPNPNSSLRSQVEELELNELREINNLLDTFFLSFPLIKSLLIKSSFESYNIHHSIFSLNFLKSLHLEIKLNNLPAEICNIQTLESLSLVATGLTTFPSNFWDNLLRLKKFTYIGHEEIEPVFFPEALKQLPDLEFVHISRVHFLCNGVPNFIRKLPGLNTLRLINTGIRTIPSFFSQLRKLNKLDLSKNSIRHYPDFMRELQLKILNLSNNPLRKKNLPYFVCEIKQLTVSDSDDEINEQSNDDLGDESSVKSNEKIRDSSNVKSDEKLCDMSNVKSNEKIRDSSNVKSDEKLCDMSNVKPDEKLCDSSNVKSNKKIRDSSNEKIRDSSNEKIRDSSNEKIRDSSNEKIRDSSNEKIRDSSNVKSDEKLYDMSNEKIHYSSNVKTVEKLCDMSNVKSDDQTVEIFSDKPSVELNEEPEEIINEIEMCSENKSNVLSLRELEQMIFAQNELNQTNDAIRDDLLLNEDQILLLIEDYLEKRMICSILSSSSGSSTQTQNICSVLEEISSHPSITYELFKYLIFLIKTDYRIQVDYSLVLIAPINTQYFCTMSDFFFYVWYYAKKLDYRENFKSNSAVANSLNPSFVSSSDMSCSTKYNLQTMVPFNEQISFVKKFLNAIELSRINNLSIPQTIKTILHSLFESNSYFLNLKNIQYSVYYVIDYVKKQLSSLVSSLNKLEYFSKLYTEVYRIISSNHYPQFESSYLLNYLYSLTICA